MAAGLVVADTDLIIDFFRGRAPGADSVRRWLTEGRLRVTSISAFELRIGTDFLERRPRIESLLSGRTLLLDALGAILAGETYVSLRADGADIGVKDCLQAGICKRHELPLATRNVRHFERVGGLEMAELEA